MVCLHALAGLASKLLHDVQVDPTLHRCATVRIEADISAMPMLLAVVQDRQGSAALLLTRPEQVVNSCFKAIMAIYVLQQVNGLHCNTTAECLTISVSLIRSFQTSSSGSQPQRYEQQPCHQSSCFTPSLRVFPAETIYFGGSAERLAASPP